MATEKISAIPTATGLPANIVVTGLVLNDDGTKDNANFTQDQIAGYAAANGKKFITPSTDSVNLTDDFLATPVSGAMMGGQVLFIGDDFTQNTGTKTVTLLNGAGFITGKKVLFFL